VVELYDVTPDWAPVYDNPVCQTFRWPLAPEAINLGVFSRNRKVNPNSTGTELDADYFEKKPKFMGCSNLIRSVFKS